MRILLAVAAAFLCAFQQDDQQGPKPKGVNVDALKGYKPVWAESGKGSWVEYKTTMAGAENLKKSVLKKIERGYSWVFSSMPSSPDFPPSKMSFFRGYHPRMVGKTTMTSKQLKIGDKTYECSVYLIMMPIHGEVRPHYVTIWRAPDAPWWALVYDFKIGKGRTLQEHTRWEVIREKEIVKVGEQEVECVVFKVTTGTSDMNRRTWTEWRSLKVPGQIVKSQKPIPFAEGEFEVTEVVGFEKK